MPDYYTANRVYPVSGPMIEDGVVVLDGDRIVEVGRRADYAGVSLREFRGALVPGFVNTHCHLELSHLKGVAPTGTGLLPFLKTVVSQREQPVEKILRAIAEEDHRMASEGIVAVGDISNAPHTAERKSTSGIRYYTFLEMFDFMQPALTEQSFANYAEVYATPGFTAGENRRTAAPHAPYTVTEGLFQKINAQNAADQPDDAYTVSIHNQETPPENALFESKTGGFLEFYRDFQMSLDHFEPTGQTAIHYALAHLNPRARTLFVHNTLSTRADIRAAHDWNPRTYWATCANANLYIENRLPDYRRFLDEDARLTLGTDSLTSNWQLSILAEMRTILRYQSYLDFETVLRWATLNGASALGYAADLGSLEVGKRPGLVHLTFDAAGQPATARRVDADFA